MPGNPALAAARTLWDALRGSRSPTVAETISGHENNYTLLRAFLAASVIYFHSFGITKATGFTDYLSGVVYPITTTGGLAVQAFFFLSGIFVTQSLSRDGNVAAFITKRFLRIWPGFIVCLFVTALLSCAVSRFGDLASYLVFDGLYEYVVRNTFFQLTWHIDGVFTDHRISEINGPIHTLPLEVRMYATLAVVGALGLIAGPIRTAIAGLALTVIALIPGLVEASPIPIFDAPYSRAAGAMFMAGVAVLGLSQWIKPRGWHVGTGIVLTLISSGPVHALLFYATVIAALLYLGRVTWLGRIARPRSDLSYGIYLYGWPCQQFVAQFFPDLNPYLLSLVALVLAIAFAAISWRLVEQPAMRFGQYLGKVKFRFWRDLASVRWPARSVTGVAILFAGCLLMQRLLLAVEFVPVRTMAATIVDFGPHASPAGAPINQQPDGSSALWIKVDGKPHTGTKVVFDGTRLEASVGDSIVTAMVPDRLLSKPGKKPILLERRTISLTERSNVVHMEISSP